MFIATTLAASLRIGSVFCARSVSLEEFVFVLMLCMWRRGKICSARAAGGIVALAGGGWEGVAWCRGVGAVGGFTAAAVTDTEEDALEDILRVETERIGQFAYRATCRGIDGYFDGFHHA